MNRQATQAFRKANLFNGIERNMPQSKYRVTFKDGSVREFETFEAFTKFVRASGSVEIVNVEAI